LTPPHPPGYPLYSFLGRLASFLPVANEALRLNLLTALLSTLTVTFTAFYLFHLFLPGGRTSSSKRIGETLTAVLAGISGSFSLAFSKTYWAQSISAKGGVYILQAFTFLALAYLMGEIAKPKGKEKVRVYPAFGLLMGLGFSAGWETQVVFAAVILVFSWITKTLIFQRGFDRRKGIQALSLAGVGFSLFLFLPLRPGRSDLMLWGHPTSSSGFLRFFTSADIRPDVSMKFMQNIVHFSTNSRDWKEAWEQMSWIVPSLNYISEHMVLDAGYWVLPLVLAGIVWFYKKKDHSFLFFGLTMVFLMIVAHGIFVRTDTENLWCINKFLLPINLFEAICMGAGMKWLLTRILDISTSRRSSRSQKRPGHGHSYAFEILAAGLALAFPTFSLVNYFPVNDQSRQVWAYDEGANLLKSLERNCIFIPEGDNCVFPLIYFQGVLKKRPDITLIPAFYLWTDWSLSELTHKLDWFPIKPGLYGALGPGQRVFYGLGAIIGGNHGRRPLQFSPNINLLDRCYFSLLPTPDGRKGIFNFLRPFGSSLLWKYKKESGGLALLGLSRNRHPEGREKADGGAIDVLFATEAQAYFNAGEFCALNGQKEGTDQYFQTALHLTHNPQLLSRIWQGRGDFWLSLGNTKGALEAFQDSIQVYAEPAGYSKHIWLLLKTGSFSRALEEANQAVDKFPQSTSTWRNLAACEAAVGNPSKAEMDLQRALSLEGKTKP
jgi:hypothetical protein